MIKTDSDSLGESEKNSPVPPAAAMGAFPMLLVPAFAVPVSMLLHVLCLVRLHEEVRLVSGPLARPAQ